MSCKIPAWYHHFPPVVYISLGIGLFRKTIFFYEFSSILIILVTPSIAHQVWLPSQKKDCHRRSKVQESLFILFIFHKIDEELGRSCIPTIQYNSHVKAVVWMRVIIILPSMIHPSMHNHHYLPLLFAHSSYCILVGQQYLALTCPVGWCIFCGLCAFAY